MSDVNKCFFTGRLGADPETRCLPSGDAICNFRIACGWKTKDKEGTEWVSISAFGKLAEICGEYLSKGSKVFVEGKFVTRQWEKDGEKRYSTEIKAEQVKFLDSKQKSEDQKPKAADDFPDDDVPF
jgi:single-strand DNA-binding protein